MKTRDDVLVEQVRRAKKVHGLTAIKIELEAKFNRKHLSSSSCEYCDDGAQECNDCEGRGDFMCSTCDGSGEVENSEGDTVTCDGCDEGWYPCDDCGGSGQQDCEDCGGTVEGSQEQREPSASDINWNEEDNDCLIAITDRLLEKVAPYGLAERGTTDYSREWKPKLPLVFTKAYDDVSVDTEQTLTLLMDDPRSVILSPKFVEAFYSLKDEIGQGVDLSNAGMHISLLFSEGGVYPSANIATDRLKFKNFRKSMILLMPALYFLGASDHKSRPMKFRKPRVHTVGMTYDHHDPDKYSAIYYNNGALEFRVFDTCYENPEVILDDISVALNCLKYWTRGYTRNYLDKVANNVSFGKDDSRELKRLFVIDEHIDLLNRGLKLIKPSYRSITELKRQRNFTVTKRDTKNHLKNARLKAEAEYQIYDNKFSWDMVIRRNNYVTRYLEDSRDEARNNIKAISDVAIKIATDKADANVKEYAKSKDTLDKFCEEQLPRLTNAGEYTLCAE